ISDSLFWAPTWLRRGRVRFFLSRAARIVTLSSQQGEVLIDHFGVRRGRLDVVPNAVPAASFAVATEADRLGARTGFDLPAGTPIVLSLCALVPEKGVDLVIDAVAALPDA